MKVFISWSGERSQKIGNALREWIPVVLHYVEPWLSHADIDAGQRWADEVAKELENSNFGILCVTRENVDSPWVLFEAGALAKSMQGSRVIPLLLDLEVRDITGPLAQFQAKKVDRTGMFEVIQALNKLATRAEPDNRVEQLFDALWPRLEKEIGAIPSTPAHSKRARPQNDILEELVTSVRSLDSRFRDIDDEPSRSLHRRWRRSHPMMMKEIFHVVGAKPGDPIGLLALASIFRDEVPWMYELGIEAYRMAKDGTPEEAAIAKKRFRRAAEMMRHGPFFEDKGMYIMMRDMERLFFEFEHEAEPEGEVKDAVSSALKKE
jgi:TIR domain